MNSVISKKDLLERIEILEQRVSALEKRNDIILADSLTQKNDTDAHVAQLWKEIFVLREKDKETSDQLYQYFDSKKKEIIEEINDLSTEERNISSVENSLNSIKSEIDNSLIEQKQSISELWNENTARQKVQKELWDNIKDIYSKIGNLSDELYQYIGEKYQFLIEKNKQELDSYKKEAWNYQFFNDNMMSDLQLSLVEQIVPGNRQKLEQLKDTHLGETCFVIGNGPSLTAADLTKLKGMKMFTFASKRINVIFAQTDWRPDVWAASDLPYIEMYQDEISNLSGFPKLIPAQAILKRGIQIKDAIYFPFLQSERNPQWFNYDILKGVHFWGTITCKLIDLAVYMGFKEIYLLGVDNTYPLKLGEDGKYQIDETKQDHFSKDYATEEQKKVLNKDIDDMVHAMEYVQSSFKTVKWFCDQKDIKIYNATRGGKLEVFPRVAMDEIKN